MAFSQSDRFAVESECGQSLEADLTNATKKTPCFSHGHSHAKLEKRISIIDGGGRSTIRPFCQRLDFAKESVESTRKPRCARGVCRYSRYQHLACGLRQFAADVEPIERTCSRIGSQLDLNYPSLTCAVQNKIRFVAIARAQMRRAMANTEGVQHSQRLFDNERLPTRTDRRMRE